MATPAAAIQNLFQTAAQLRTAPPGQKAQLVADMIMQFGVDLNALDGALTSRLSGRPQQGGHPLDPVMQMIDQRLQPVQQFINTFQQNRQQADQQIEQQAVSSWETFANDAKNEFAWDLKDEIADILELAARRGQVVSLQDAYARATLAHPTISGIVQRRN